MSQRVHARPVMLEQPTTDVSVAFLDVATVDVEYDPATGTLYIQVTRADDAACQQFRVDVPVRYGCTS